MKTAHHTEPTPRERIIASWARLQEECDSMIDLNEKMRARMFTEGVDEFTDIAEACDAIGIPSDYFDGEEIRAVFVDRATGWHYWERDTGKFYTIIDRDCFETETAEEIQDVMRTHFFT